ncbi:MAG: DUF4268 domain-containing protein [Bacteroidales bacterium]|nr:DUF4268 domain-containing protein [Bacteroidales bacterium]
MKGEEFNLYFVSSKYITDEEFEEVGGANHISLTSLQQIYYGAPGTGKSHSINEQTEGESVIRTTFHPDSDYSTFVGAYKPTTKEVELRDVTGHKVMENGKVVTEDRIVYEFVDQAFLQAYVNAWKFYAENEEEPKKQFLVIEEINRGNCAQIFGDLFQLLDRNEWGFSDYPINADKDMKKQLKKALAGLSIADAETINGLYKGRDVVKEVLEGDILLLPNNLYIWATMNTSDQSLFPIDSAFKRRWDWQYMPIAQGRDEAGRELVWTIDVNGIKYSWWSFLEKINAQIGEATQSEDKKLGFFFCKAKDGVITPETFVGKVVFYLWNDVFKDYGFEGSIFKDKDGTELSFNKFYAADLKGNAVVQKDKVELFLNNLGVEVTGYNEDDIIVEMDDDEVTEDNKKSLKDQRYDFWAAFLDYARQKPEYMQYFSGRTTPSTDKWYNFFFSQKECHLCVEQTRTRNELSVGLYFRETTEKYYKLEGYKTKIEEELGITFDWQNKPGVKSSYIVETMYNVDFNDISKQQEYFDHIIDRLIRMRTTFLKFINI